MPKIILNSMFAVVISICVTSTGANAYGHEGEDHSHEAAATIASSESMNVRLARAGDVEITFKHPRIEPDRATLARIFLTRFETNEPISDAHITLIFNSGDNNLSPATTVTIVATRTATSGLYEIDLPPLPEGSYEINGRLQLNGAPREVNLGPLNVQTPASPPIESASLWARKVLIAFALLVICAAAFLFFRAAHRRGNDAAATT